ncbi:MAG: hypothetical protein U9R08_01510 [Nanoarchaeota archaeon]|nr:hypothetical protein [Nanoarchaeota archaeon]
MSYEICEEQVKVIIDEIKETLESHPRYGSCISEVIADDSSQGLKDLHVRVVTNFEDCSDRRALGEVLKRISSDYLSMDQVVHFHQYRS